MKNYQEMLYEARSKFQRSVNNKLSKFYRTFLIYKIKTHIRDGPYFITIYKHDKLLGNGTV